MTAKPRHFCAEESLAIGDPLVGTGTHAEHNLLISWPRAHWQRSMRRAGDMPEEVSTEIEAIAASGRRVNLIHRREQPSHRHCIFLMPERLRYDVPRDELLAFLQALQGGAALARWQADRVEGSLILCCTHGKKDKCCAKFGFRTYQAIADEARRQPHLFEVWESTHLGGCRLAASAIVFPQRHKYGRIAFDDIPLLLQAEAEGRPYLPCYRGDSRLAPAEQCAQVAALEWLQSRDLRGEVQVEGESAVGDDHRLVVTVRWQAPPQRGWLVVTCVASELIRHDTCADYAGEGAKPSRVWKARGATPVTHGLGHQANICSDRSPSA
ncbi:sucrase ferredoxin [Halomonas sp. NO4]|uniref:sucrase ferredoxin n=1 Tax=Halomonas sp. NO4 TaxID=2484813 RepID=UPI0013D4FB3E|nr:sucrase ferredoxin [Halomonas sp. NO4]